MKVIYLGNGRTPYSWEDIELLIKEARKYGISIGSNCTIESDCTIWYNCTIESNCLTSFHLGKLYKYGVFVRIEERKTFIKLGCYDRTIEEWDADFYNNDKEFPRDSKELRLREEAYATARKIAVELRNNLVKG